MKNWTVILYSSMLASAILLTGCGSGSGGVSSSSSGGPGVPPAAAGGAVAGVAAKGILSRAIVTAYCGNSEAAADQLATGPADAAGQYSLTWTTACAKPVKLVVTVDANTTIADEATGTNVTPLASFKLRALVADPDTTSIKNITPLTHMAAAIARTSATLSKTAASNAEAAVINTVLGGDIDAYQATPLPPTAAAMNTASVGEQKLATLLTVISAFAQDPTTVAACGLLVGNGARLQCALDAFVNQAMTTVTAVSDTGYTVATPLPAITPATMLATTLSKIKTAATNETTSLITATGSQAVSTVVTADTSGLAALLASATSNLTTAAASTGGTVVLAAASGIQAARDLFNGLKNDLLALSNGSGNGFLDQKLSAMQADFTSIANTSATGSTHSIRVLQRALDLAHEAKTATWTKPDVTLVANAVYPIFNSDVALETDGAAAPLRFVRSHGDGTNCYVQFSDFTAHLGKAGCYEGNGRPNVPLTATTFTGFYHAVEVVESTTTSGIYTWHDFMASRNYNMTFRTFPLGFYPINGNGRNVAITPQVATSTQQTGTAVVTWNTTTGEVTAATINGNIQPLIPGQDFSTLDNIILTSRISAASETFTLDGTVTNVLAGATTLTVALQSGSQFVHSIASATTTDHPISGKFIVQIKTTLFQFDGTLSVDNFTRDLDPNPDYLPANASFTGKISTLAGGIDGIATEFLNGTLGVSLANVAAFDPSVPTSESNFLKATVTFSGKVTSDSATFELTLIVDRSTFGKESVTLNYARNGSEMVSVTGTTSAATNTLTIHGSGDVSAVLTNGIGDVNVGNTKIGSITKNPSQVTFTDGTFLLL